MMTSRLKLVPATVRILDAELAGREALETLLGVTAPEDWPPGEYDTDAIRFFRTRLAEGGGSVVGWYGWYAIAEKKLLGAGGYFGPPDADGVVEIGYSIASEHQRLGYATELVRALVQRAIETAGVTEVIAHTTLDNIGSVKVLTNCGFVAAGEGREAGTVRFVFRDSAASARSSSRVPASKDQR